MSSISRQQGSNAGETFISRAYSRILARSRGFTQELFALNVVLDLERMNGMDRMVE